MALPDWVLVNTLSVNVRTQAPVSVLQSFAVKLPKFPIVEVGEVAESKTTVAGEGTNVSASVRAWPVNLPRFVNAPTLPELVNLPTLPKLVELPKFAKSPWPVTARM